MKVGEGHGVKLRPCSGHRTEVIAGILRPLWQQDALKGTYSLEAVTRPRGPAFLDLDFGQMRQTEMR